MPPKAPKRAVPAQPVEPQAAPLEQTIPTMFSSVKVPLGADAHVARLQKAVLDGSIDGMLAACWRLAGSKVGQTPPMCVACPKREGNLKDLCKASLPTTSLMFSGTLTQLDATFRAIDVGMDVAKVQFVLQNADSVTALRSLIGSITINYDTWTSDEPARLQRAHKDAELDALVLLINWYDDDVDVAKALLDVATDLIFEAKSMHTGSKFCSERLRILDLEEKNRKVIGASGARRCFFMADMVVLALAEKRGGDPTKGEADVLMQVLKEDKVDTTGWSSDTCRRYLVVGRKLGIPPLKNLLIRWEMFEARDCLVDGIAALRSVTQAASLDEDYGYILEVLFMEQRSRIRTTLCRKGNLTVPVIMKALLMRRGIWVHLKMLFPKFDELITSYSGNDFYLREYGTSPDGTRDPAFADKLEGSDSDDDGAEKKVPEGDTSSYKSRAPLMRLCSRLAKNLFERTLACMVTDAVKGAPSTHVDLTSTAATKLRVAINGVKVLYDMDFPVVAQQVQSTVIHRPSQSSPHEVHVHVTAAIDDEETYKTKLADWNAAVAHYADQEQENFLHGHCTLVVNDDQLKRKLRRIPILNEKKRKLFNLEAQNMKPLDWDRIKRRKKSMFQPTTETIEEDDATLLIEVYNHCKTVDEDRVSSDVVHYI